jgi:hypothetical protein
VGNEGNGERKADYQEHDTQSSMIRCLIPWLNLILSKTEAIGVLFSCTRVCTHGTMSCIHRRRQSESASSNILFRLTLSFVVVANHRHEASLVRCWEKRRADEARPAQTDRQPIDQSSKPRRRIRMAERLDWTGHR